MAYFKDLSTKNYFDKDGPYFYGFKKLYSIGWIDEGKPYNKGKVPKEFIQKLKELIKTPHIGMPYRGYHNCYFCDETLGDDELFILGKNKIYVCPDSIDHYIEKHNYCPPKEFINAVMNTEKLSGEDYKNELKRIDERVYLFLERGFSTSGLSRDAFIARRTKVQPWTKEWNRISKLENKKNQKENKRIEKERKQQIQEQIERDRISQEKRNELRNRFKDGELFDKIMRVFNDEDFLALKNKIK